MGADHRNSNWNLRAGNVARLLAGSHHCLFLSDDAHSYGGGDIVEGGGRDIFGTGFRVSSSFMVKK